MNSDPMRAKAIAILAEMIHEINVAMLTTITADGALRSRPMINAETEFDGDLWFFTDVSAPKVEEVEHHRQVNVSYASPQDRRFVSISGVAELVRDDRKVEILWDPKFAGWFPQPVDESKLGFLKVAVERAEYWDAGSGHMQPIMGIAKSIVGKSKSQSRRPEHGKVEWLSSSRAERSSPIQRP